MEQKVQLQKKLDKANKEKKILMQLITQHKAEKKQAQLAAQQAQEAQQLEIVKQQLKQDTRQLEKQAKQ